MGSRQVKPDDVNTDPCTYSDTFQFTGDNLDERCKVRYELIAEGLIKNKGSYPTGLYKNDRLIFGEAGSLKMPYLPYIDHKVLYFILDPIMWVSIIVLIICIIIYFATSCKTKENTLYPLIISAVSTVITISIKCYHSYKEGKLYKRFQTNPHIVKEFTKSMQGYLDEKVSNEKISKEKQPQFLDDYSFDYVDAYLADYDINHNFNKAEKAAATKIDELSNKPK